MSGCFDQDAREKVLGVGPAASMQWYVPEYDKAVVPMKRYGQIELTPDLKVQVTPDCVGDTRICEQIVAAVSNAPALLTELRRLRRVEEAAKEWKEADLNCRVVCARYDATAADINDAHALFQQSEQALRDALEGKC